MSLIPGKYQHYKNENVDDYFSATGVPYFVRKMISLSSPTIEIIKEDDTMTIKNYNLISNLETTFKIGEDYEEKMPRNSVLKSKTTIINDHEMETVSINPADGLKNTRQYFFTDDECVITMSHEKAATPGKRYFRRIK